MIIFVVIVVALMLLCIYNDIINLIEERKTTTYKTANFITLENKKGGKQ